MSKCIRCGRELDSGSSNNMCSDCSQKNYSIDPPINNGHIHYVDEDKALILIRDVIAKEKDEHTLNVLKSLYYDLVHIEENSGSNIGFVDGPTTDDTTTQTTGIEDSLVAENSEEELKSYKAKLKECVGDLYATRHRSNHENDELREVVEHEREKLKRFKERVQRHINYQYNVFTYNEKENKK